MTAQELAEKILSMIKKVDDQWTAVTETTQRDLLLAVVEDIEALCNEQLEGSSSHDLQP